MATLGRKVTAAKEEADVLLLAIQLENDGPADLIMASASQAQNRTEELGVRSDLLRIALLLSHGGPSGYQMWEHFQHHFMSKALQDLFFAKLCHLSRSIASACLVGYGESDFSREDSPPVWDDSLLPRSTAPFVIRLMTLQPGILEHFLPRFFIRASDAGRENSKYLRSMRILMAVPELGWSQKPHTAALRRLGDFRGVPLKTAEENVKKLIARMRTKHRWLAQVWIEAGRKLAESE